MWCEVNIFTNEPDCKRSWRNMLYFHFSKLVIKTQCLVFKIYISQVTKVKEIASSSFKFIPCLRYEIFGASAQFTSLAPQALLGMLRKELLEKIKFQWKNNFYKKKSLARSLTFWWKGLNWLSSCKERIDIFESSALHFASYAKELSNTIRLGDTKKSCASEQIFWLIDKSHLF